MENDITKLLTVKEAAKELTLNENTFWTLIKRKKVPKDLIFKPAGQDAKKATTRIRKNILNKWIAGEITA